MAGTNFPVTRVWWLWEFTWLTLDCSELMVYLNNLLRVKNWALYLLVLKMVSADTVNKIANLATTEYVGTVLVMCVSLYFTRLKLFSVNEKKLGFRERIVFSWYFMICITSFKYKLRLGTNQNNMRINNWNTVTKTIGMIFSISCDYIYGLVFTKTGTNEHSLSGIRVHKREETVLKVIHIFVK